MEKKYFLELLNSLNISEDIILSIASEKGFVERIRLIKPPDYLYSMCSESINGTVSCNDIAANMETNNGTSVSRQAVYKKMTDSCCSFFQEVLSMIIKAKIKNSQIDEIRPLKNFKRVLVQDSTIIRLPSRLLPIYSGVSNNTTVACNARIQGVYDLISESFIYFTIDPYSKNDLDSASDLCLQKGDLTLRDRGYLKLGEFQRHIDAEANCIFRYKHNMLLLDPVSRKPINLLSLLKKEKNIDMEVMLNNKERSVVRLVATPVDKKIANHRRRKAKKENKSKPSKEYLAELSWSIFITTIPKEIADYVLIFKLYCLRWRIEIIFKSWKSNMSFAEIHDVSNIQLTVLLMARFIMILICSQLIFCPCRILVKQHFNKDLSLMKLTHYLIRNPQKITELLKVVHEYQGKAQNSFYSLSRYCAYDKRKRSNFQQELDWAFSLS